MRGGHRNRQYRWREGALALRGKAVVVCARNRLMLHAAAGIVLGSLHGAGSPFGTRMACYVAERVPALRPSVALYVAA